MPDDDKPEHRYPWIETGSLDPSEILFSVYWWLCPPGGIWGGLKQLGCYSCRSCSSGADNERTYTSTPPCFHGLRRGNFTSRFHLNFNLRSLETNHRLLVWVCVRACVSACIFCTRHKLLFLQAVARNLSHWRTWEVPCWSLREGTVCLWPRPLSSVHSRLKRAEVMSWHICNHRITNFCREGSLFNKCKK